MAGPLAPDQKSPRTKPAHLMCRNRFWGVMGAIACAYFGYLAYERVRDADFPWPHDLWSLLTYSVWIALALGLLSETRCWRERIFFGLVLANVASGLAFSLWTTAPMTYSRDAREAVLLVWILAAAASLTTLSRQKEDAGAK